MGYGERKSPSGVQGHSPDWALGEPPWGLGAKPEMLISSYDGGATMSPFGYATGVVAHEQTDPRLTLHIPLDAGR